jgi:hypothetical protein
VSDDLVVDDGAYAFFLLRARCEKPTIAKRPAHGLCYALANLALGCPVTGMEYANGRFDGSYHA